MAIKKFIVEVDYTPYEDNDPVDASLVEEGVTEIVKSMVMDGELDDFNGINVKVVDKF